MSASIRDSVELKLERGSLRTSNVDRFTFYKKLKAFEKRTGKKVAGAILGEPLAEIIVLPKSLVPFLSEKAASISLDSGNPDEVESLPPPNSEGVSPCYR